MRKILGVLTLLLCLAATAAHAQLPVTLPAGTVVGRTVSAGPGDPEAIPLSTLLAQVLAAPNAVANSSLAQAPAATLKGNDTGATANVADLTVAQVLTLLNNPQRIYSYQVDLNVVGDTTCAFTLPSGFTRYQLGAVRVTNTSNTASLNTAQVGLFTGAGGTGTQIVSTGSSLAGATTNAANTNGAFVQLTLAVGGSAYFTANPIYFRVTAGQGAATNQATVTVTIQVVPVS